LHNVHLCSSNYPQNYINHHLSQDNIFPVTIA
jgi:hypothetical protein